MATEYKLSYTAREIDERLGRVDEIEKIYKQNEEPIDATEGSLWIDLDAEGGSGTGGSGSGNSSTIVASVQADWNQNDPEQPNYVENRTHYEEGRRSLLNIVWDGTYDESRYSVDCVMDGEQMTYVKVSDVVLTPAEAAQCTTTTSNYENAVSTYAFDDAFIHDVFVLIVRNAPYKFEVSDEPVIFEQTGIYFASIPNNLYVSQLKSETVTIPGSDVIVHRLANKYLPENVVCSKNEQKILDIKWDGQFELGDIITFSNFANCEVVQVSNAIISDEEFIQCTFKASSNPFFGTISSENLEKFGNNTVALIPGVMILRDPSQPVYNKNIENYSPGIYFIRSYNSNGELGFYISNLSNSNAVIIEDKIPVDLLPIEKIPISDLRVNNSDSPRYVAGRTHWIKSTQSKGIIDSIITADGIENESLFGLEEGANYLVTLNNKDYEVTCMREVIQDENGLFYVLSLGSFQDLSNGVNDLPFSVVDAYTLIQNDGAEIPLFVGVCVADVTEETPIKVVQKIEDIKTLPKKYLPEDSLYAEKTKVPLNIKWDGYIKTSKFFEIDLNDYVYISDLILTDEEFAKCKYKTYSKNGDSEEILISEEGYTTEENNTISKSMAIMILRNPSKLTDMFEEYKPGIYFARTIVNNVLEFYVSSFSSEEVLVNSENKIPNKYLPEIPIFDFIEMGLPAIVPDIALTGECVELTGIDLTEFEKALQKGIIRIRVAFRIGENDERHITATCMPVYDETLMFWQLGVIAFAGSFTEPTVRTILTYDVPNNLIKAHSALLQYYTTTM